MAAIQNPTERLSRLIAFDLELCIRVQARSGEKLRRALGVVSRLGDGWIWLATAVALPLVHGAAALPILWELVLTAALCVVLYKTLKRGTARPRPCAVAESLQEVVPALDLYSFPSGHTRHAVAFTVVIAGQLPGWGWLLIPFSVAVALSRIVLGLHYPTDVAAGAGIGAVVGIAGSLML